MIPLKIRALRPSRREWPVDEFPVRIVWSDLHRFVRLSQSGTCIHLVLGTGSLRGGALSWIGGSRSQETAPETEQAPKERPGGWIPGGASGARNRGETPLPQSDAPFGRIKKLMADG